MSKQENNAVRFIWEDLSGSIVEDASLRQVSGMETDQIGGQK